MERPRFSGDLSLDLRKQAIKLMEEYRSFLKIDKNDLDTALLEQPDIFYRVANEYSLALSRKDQAKTLLDEAEAEADQLIRRDAEEEKEKISETVVKERIILDPEVKTRRMEYVSWVGLAGRWEAMRDSFTQRSYALKELVTLYATGYFGDVTGTGARNDAAGRQYETNRDSLAQERARRRAEKTKG